MLIMRLARFRILDVMEFWVPALCALLLAAVSLPAMAQTACPVGATPGSVVCGPDPVAAQSQGPSVPFQRLDGYGAMAWSADAGLTYTETRNGGEGTDRAVVNGAMEYCRSAGNSDCVIKLTWENACAAAATKPLNGQRQWVGITARTEFGARRAIRRACEELPGDGQCKINRVYCRRPVSGYFNDY